MGSPTKTALSRGFCAPAQPYMQGSLPTRVGRLQHEHVCASPGGGGPARPPSAAARGAPPAHRAHAHASLAKQPADREARHRRDLAHAALDHLALGGGHGGARERGAAERVLVDDVVRDELAVRALERRRADRERLELVRLAVEPGARRVGDAVPITLEPMIVDAFGVPERQETISVSRGGACPSWMNILV